MINIAYFTQKHAFLHTKNKLLIISILIVKKGYNGGECIKLAVISLKIVIFVVLFMHTK